MAQTYMNGLSIGHSWLKPEGGHLNTVIDDICLKKKGIR